MIQGVGRRSLTAKAQVLSSANPCQNCGGQSGSGAGFSLSTPIFLYQYHSTYVPYSQAPSSYSCQKDKRTKPGLSHMRE